MGRVIITGEDVRKHIAVSYMSSDIFDSSHFIHKYYLSSDDKGKLFPVDISALEVMVDSLNGEESLSFRMTGTLPRVPARMHYCLQ